MSHFKVSIIRALEAYEWHWAILVLGVKMNPPSRMQNAVISPYPDRLPLPVPQQQDLRGQDKGQRKSIARVQVSYQL